MLTPKRQFWCCAIGTVREQVAIHGGSTGRRPLSAAAARLCRLSLRERKPFAERKATLGARDVKSRNTKTGASGWYGHEAGSEGH